MILLIEDRAERQKQILETKSKLQEYGDILDNAVEDRYEEIFEQLRTDRFKWENYTCIITHQSAFGDHNSEIISYLQRHSEIHDIPLVEFSGGIDAPFFNMPSKQLRINSRVLYGNIIFFLDNVRASGEVNILLLAYGTKWRINLVANVIRKIENFLDMSIQDDVLFSRFARRSDMESLDITGFDLYRLQPESNRISRHEIKKILKSLHSFIEDLADGN